MRPQVQLVQDQFYSILESDLYHFQRSSDRRSARSAMTEIEYQLSVKQCHLFLEHARVDATSPNSFQSSLAHDADNARKLCSSNSLKNKKIDKNLTVN